jgi:hypothetical protein
MHGLYSSEVRTILNRCNALYATPYEKTKNGFVLITRPNYIKRSFGFVQLKWIHLLAVGLSFTRSMNIKEIEIRLLALAIAAFYFATSYLSTMYADKSRVRDIIALLNALLKLERHHIISSEIKSKSHYFNLKNKLI